MKRPLRIKQIKTTPLKIFTLYARNEKPRAGGKVPRTPGRRGAGKKGAPKSD